MTCVITAPGQLSLLSGSEKLTTALHTLSLHAALPISSTGQMIAGGSLSRTVTVKLHVALFPAASVTWNTFVVTPTGNAAPFVDPAICIGTAPVQLSLPTGGV